MNKVSRLGAHLSGHGDISDLARRVGISRSAMSLVAHGRMRPSVDLARRISVATEGRVTVKELLLGDEAPHLLERWSENDPTPTPEQVAAWMLARGASPSADAPGAAPIHGRAAQ